MGYKKVSQGEVTFKYKFLPGDLFFVFLGNPMLAQNRAFQLDYMFCSCKDFRFCYLSLARFSLSYFCDCPDHSQ